MKGILSKQRSRVLHPLLHDAAVGITFARSPKLLGDRLACICMCMRPRHAAEPQAQASRYSCTFRMHQSFSMAHA